MVAVLLILVFVVIPIIVIVLVLVVIFILVVIAATNWGWNQDGAIAGGWNRGGNVGWGLAGINAWGHIRRWISGRINRSSWRLVDHDGGLFTPERRENSRFTGKRTPDRETEACSENERGDG